jgi:tetratricopeptide (TPR) repeat protein
MRRQCLPPSRTTLERSSFHLTLPSHWVQILVRRELETTAKEVGERVRSGTATGEEFFELGVVLLRKKSYTQAITNLQKALAVWDGEPEEKAQAYNALGCEPRSTAPPACYITSTPPRAFSSNSRCGPVPERRGGGGVGCSFALFMQEKHEAAVEQYKKAVELQSGCALPPPVPCRHTVDASRACTLMLQAES